MVAPRAVAPCVLTRVVSDDAQRIAMGFVEQLMVQVDVLDSLAVEQPPTRSARIPRCRTTDVLYHELSQIVAAANAAFDVELDGDFEGVCLLRYDAGDRLHWHLDYGGYPSSGGRRKLSVVVQLSDDPDYAGGDLEFATSPKHPFQRKRGTAIVFPSFLAHQVTTVTAGTRFVIAAFATGEPYR